MFFMHKVLSFGELLLRFEALPITDEITESRRLYATFPGGAEANVSFALASLGIPVSFFTVIPDNLLAKNALGIMKKNGVDVSKILIKDGRIGSYFLLGANGLTTGNVIYDRKFSSFCDVNAEEIDWDSIFTDCTWLHWTAITPALSQKWILLIKRCLQEARQRNIFISVDLNYRSRLWDFGTDPIDVMPQLVSFCDVIMGNIWASHTMLGTPIDENLHRFTSKSEYFEFAKKTSTEIFARFPNCKHIANTFRFMDNPNHNLLFGTYHNLEGDWVSQSFETNDLKDRIGSGDAFMSGLIYGLCKNLAPQEIIDYATITGYKKLFIKGDFLHKAQK